MKRWERPLLLFSVALNIAFLTIGATRSVTRETPASRLLAPDSTQAAKHLERWRTRRHATMARKLHLDAQQLHALDAGFEAVHPALRQSRQEAHQHRMRYAQALARGDQAAARAAARAVSRAQARVDSLCAEAMIHETSVLGPEQRARYVSWTFRDGPRGGRGFERGGRRGSPHFPIAPDSHDSLHPQVERNSP